MEPNNNQILTSGPMVVGDKNDKKQFYIMIALAVVAVLGVGFGIAGTVIGTQKSGEVAHLEEQLAEKTENSGTTNGNLSVPIVIEEKKEEQMAQENVAETNAELAHDYIYVGAWGKRFKVPSDLVSVSYFYNGAQDYLCVTGVKYIEGGMHYFPEFGRLIANDGNENCMGIVSREWNNETGRQGYRYAHAQAVFSRDQAEIDWETQSANLVKDLLTKNMEDF